jgi:hypothetical protein
LFVESSGPHRKLLLLSLGVWPVITSVPAFLVALCMNAGLFLARGDGVNR